MREIDVAYEKYSKEMAKKDSQESLSYFLYEKAMAKKYSQEAIDQLRENHKEMLKEQEEIEELMNP